MSDFDWDQWKSWSERATDLDLISKGCFCDGKPCNCERDSNLVWLNYAAYVRDLSPPAVRAVDRFGKPMTKFADGSKTPYEFIEWLEYSYSLVDKFHELLVNSNAFQWADLYFRNEDDFYSGSYNHFSPISLLLARKLHNDQLAHRSYEVIHSGVNLFDNIRPIDYENRKKFREGGKQIFHEL